MLLCDTNYVYVRTLRDGPGLVNDTIFINQENTICDFALDNLNGSVVNIQNFCADTPTAVDFTLDTFNYCLNITGLMPGQDTACLQFTDELGNVDTIYYIVDVLNPISEVIEDDIRLGNTIAGSIDNFFVLPELSGGVGPSKGIAFADGDCIVTYIPGQDSCGFDQFSYVVANEFGSDTTTVTVFIECDQGQPGELFVFNGFSPNNDGINDFFRVNGLENFPDHTLYVYNRWGNQVLVATDYQNDWAGTWEGLTLPDGTYYYLLERGDGERVSGFVQIHR